MKTPFGAIVASGTTFGNSWKTLEDCVDVAAMHAEDSQTG